MTVLDLIFNRKYGYNNLYGNLSISGITPEPEKVIDLTDKFNYTLNEGNIEITGLTSEGTSWLKSDTLIEGQSKEVGELVIPDYLVINKVKHPVKSIGANAFKSNLDLVKVSMSDSVEKLWYSCFRECTNLVSCRLSDNISDWGKSLVSDETNGGSIFRDCTNLQEVNIPSKVTNIPKSCFLDCHSLKSIVIDRPLELGHQAFRESGLVNINLPEGTTLAGYSDITNKLGLQFTDCTSLSSITLPDSIKIVPYCCFDGCKSLVSVTLGKEVTELGCSSFNNCTSLSCIVIPNTCEKIYHLAFQNCSELKDITLPIDCDIKDYSVGSNYRTFYGCKNIRKVTYTGGRTGLDIEDNYSYSSTNGTPYSCGQPNGSVELVFADGVKKIRYSNFSSRDTIKSISIPNTLEYLDSSAFNGCSRITDIYWNNIHNELYGTGTSYMLYDLGKDSNPVFHFGDIFGETDKFIKDGVNYVPYNIFNDGTRTGGTAMYYMFCHSVDWGTFKPDNLNNAFYCSTFVDVTIPDSVHTIYKNDFAWSRLKIVRLSKGTTKIEAGAFYESDDITDVYYDGTKEERDANLTIASSNNSYLINATWHYKDAA
jgi:hypothetical protein